MTWVLTTVLRYVVGTTMVDKYVLVTKSVAVETDNWVETSVSVCVSVLKYVWSEVNVEVAVSVCSTV